MTVCVRNRQRRLKVNGPLLRALASKALSFAPNCSGRTPKGFAPCHSLEHLSIVLVNDQAMAGFNEKFHQTAEPTDILTFAYPELGEAELIISVDRAVAHAVRFRTTLSRELALYVVHGILHVHGYDDLSPQPRRRMRAAERRLLARLDRAFDLKKLVR